MRTLNAHPNFRWTTHEAPHRTREEWKVPKKQALLEVNKFLSMHPTTQVVSTDAEAILGLGIPGSPTDCCGRLLLMNYSSGLYSKFASWNAGTVDARFSSATLLMVRGISSLRSRVGSQVRLYSDATALRTRGISGARGCRLSCLPFAEAD